MLILSLMALNMPLIVALRGHPFMTSTENQGFWPTSPLTTCVHMSQTPSPLRMNVINGWPLMFCYQGHSHEKMLKVAALVSVQFDRIFLHFKALINSIKCI